MLKRNVLILHRGLAPARTGMPLEILLVGFCPPLLRGYIIRAPLLRSP